MKNWLTAFVYFTLAMGIAAGCTSGAPTPTVTVAPTATASPTSTPLPIKEWNLEDVQVDGATVTVSLRVYVGIGVQATLDGKLADEVRDTLPILEYVFLSVAPGQHPVEVQDVVGYTETAEVVVPSPTPENPAWLNDLIYRQQNEPVANPPAFIARYDYRGQTVYFLPQRCCDIFSNLYDAEGSVIGHPDGGITGQGDGRVSHFFEVRSNETVVWRDQRTYDPDLVQVPAPIESVKLNIMESFPLQYSLIVVSGLPNTCVSYGGYHGCERHDRVFAGRAPSAGSGQALHPHLDHVVVV